MDTYYVNVSCTYKLRIIFSQTALSYTSSLHQNALVEKNNWFIFLLKGFLKTIFFFLTLYKNKQDHPYGTISYVLTQEAASERMQSTGSWIYSANSCLPMLRRNENTCAPCGYPFRKKYHQIFIHGLNIWLLNSAKKIGTGFCFFACITYLYSN